MQLPNSNNTQAEWGGFKNVESGGYVLGLILAEEGKTSATAKNPNVDKIRFNFDMIEGKFQFNYGEWSKRANANRYLKLDISVAQMGKLVYTLQHLGEQTGGNQKAYIDQALAVQDIDVGKLTEAHLKTGAILEFNDNGFLEIKELISVEEARKIGPSGKTAPRKASGGNAYGNSGGFGGQEASFSEGGFGFGGGEQQQQQQPDNSGEQAGGFGDGFGF